MSEKTPSPEQIAEFHATLIRSAAKAVFSADEMQNVIGSTTTAKRIFSEYLARQRRNGERDARWFCKSAFGTESMYSGPIPLRPKNDENAQVVVVPRGYTVEKILEEKVRLVYDRKIRPYVHERVPLNAPYTLWAGSMRLPEKYEFSSWEARQYYKPGITLIEGLLLYYHTWNRWPEESGRKFLDPDHTLICVGSQVPSDDIHTRTCPGISWKDNQLHIDSYNLENLPENAVSRTVYLKHM